ncbi:MAG TPA: hypothetical protein VE402_01170, partial [Candidatus Angelobacter sp.]|nr:hypothetical protein [Candidatus Angelobacter sp.]
MDGVGQAVHEVLPVGVAPSGMRRERGLPDAQLLDRCCVEAGQLGQGLRDGVTRRDLSLRLPHPQIGDGIVQVGAHELRPLDVVLPVHRRFDIRVLVQVHELVLRPAQGIHRPLLEFTGERRQLILHLGQERRARETVLGVEPRFGDRLRPVEDAFQPLPILRDAFRRDVVQAVVVALVADARGGGGTGLQLALPEFVAQLRQRVVGCRGVPRREEDQEGQEGEAGQQAGDHRASPWFRSFVSRLGG